jgi:hypothetical protein
MYATKWVVMQTVFPSKIDATSAAPLIVAGFAAVAACIVLAGSAFPEKWFMVVLILLILVGFPVWIITSTYYTLTSNELAIRSGPFSWKISFRDITAVERTTSRRSGPALSMDRLRIGYGQGESILISPDNKEEFLLELYARRNELTRPPIGTNNQSIKAGSGK